LNIGKYIIFINLIFSILYKQLIPYKEYFLKILKIFLIFKSSVSKIIGVVFDKKE
jgi:hypothetical protein